MLRLASALALATAVTVSAPAFAADAQLQAAVNGAQRAPEHKARDAARHPVETLTFWGLKPKQTVIEVSPGSGYWTEILAPYAKATGGTYVRSLARSSCACAAHCHRGRHALAPHHACVEHVHMPDIRSTWSWPGTPSVCRI